MRRAKSASSLTGGPDRIETPGPERKGLGKQVRWRGGGREEEKAICTGLGWEQTLSQRSPLGEPKGWAQDRKELNLIWGFVVWVMHFELKIEIDVFMQLGFLSLCFLIVTSEETNLGPTD